VSHRHPDQPDDCWLPDEPLDLLKLAGYTVGLGVVLVGLLFVVLLGWVPA
jgi:hypothetical protein